MLSRQFGFLFIHVPKTAGNAIQHALLPYSEDHLVLSQPHHDGEDRFEIGSPGLQVHKHSTLSAYRDQLGDEFLRELLVFTVVRDPWERCVSHYFSPHRGEISWDKEAFRAFVQREVMPLEYYLRLAGDATASDAFERLDVTLRFERLTSDLDGLRRRLGLPELAFKARNVGKHRAYPEYYQEDPSLVDLVADRFRAEIETYDYRFPS
ncbi:MAG: sulfotransferase family 2 domain-containing protein [Xanthomonadales bacterium]|jgi:hypothetical protein|nr:sulfotransferase family 2 domain-containing protein [Xanthomonadales bacterium]